MACRPLKVMILYIFSKYKEDTEIFQYGTLSHILQVEYSSDRWAGTWSEGKPNERGEATYTVDHP